MLVFSGYGTLVPQGIRCVLPGQVGCAGGLFGSAVLPANASLEQWFNVTMYDYGFWIINTDDGTNETNAWYIYEGWTVHVNATSLRANPAVGGTAYHGLGIEINATGTQLLALAAPVGVWVASSFVAPTSPYSNQRIWCTVECGPGHGGQHMNNLFVVPATVMPTVTVSANRTAGSPPLPVAFQGSAKSGTPPYNLSWDFGDGGSAFGTLNVTHTYTAGGAYSASLSIVDAKGFRASRAVAIDVASTAPLRVNVSASPSSGVAPVIAHLLGAVTGAVPPYTYSWAFGDGTTANGPAAAHAYATPGIYAAVVTVRDSMGASTVGWVSVTVRPAQGHFSVVVSPSPAKGTAPFNASLTASPRGGAAPYTDEWIFGDGTVGVGAPVSHTYSVTGWYQAVVFVSDSAGNVGTTVTNISVAGAAGSPLVGRITESPSVGAPPLTVNASVSIQGGSGTYGAVRWAFGDGTNGLGAVTSHTFSALGIYNMTATILDTGGSNPPPNDTAASNLCWAVVQVVGLGFQIAVNQTVGDAPFSVSGIASIVGGSGAYGPVTWSWGDGTQSTGIEANHTYASKVSGTVTIRAVGSDSSGTQRNASLSVEVFPALAARLTAVPPHASLAPVTVTFTLTVTGGTGNYSTRPAWRYGDGTTGRGPSPDTHVYARTGHFLVSSLTNDSAGAQAIATVWVNISSGSPGGTVPPVWVVPTLPDPNQVALALMGIVAAVGLVLLYRRRHRQSVKPAQPAIQSSSSHGTESEPRRSP